MGANNATGSSWWRLNKREGLFLGAFTLIGLALAFLAGAAVSGNSSLAGYLPPRSSTPAPSTPPNLTAEDFYLSGTVTGRANPATPFYQQYLQLWYKKPTGGSMILIPGRLSADPTASIMGTVSGIKAMVNTPDIFILSGKLVGTPKGDYSCTVNKATLHVGCNLPGSHWEGVLDQNSVIRVKATSLLTK